MLCRWKGRLADWVDWVHGSFISVAHPSARCSCPLLLFPLLRPLGDKKRSSPSTSPAAAVLRPAQSPMRSMTRVAAAAAFLALTTAPLAHGASQCYYPSGSKSSDVPCDPDAEVSMCCGSRDACLSSGLCRIDGTGANVGISYARGTCTDQTWGSPICPQRCRRSVLFFLILLQRSRVLGRHLC